MHADARLLCLLAILLAAPYCLCLGSSAASLRSEPGSSGPVPEPLAPRSKAHAGSNRTASAYIHMELLLRQVVAECAKGEDTVLQLDSTGQLQVLPHLPADAPCAALDIALRGSERGVGTCTDVALYLLHMGNTGEPGRGARIVPLLAPADMAAYSTTCTPTTARMFLESMYHEWLAPNGTGGYHLMQVNSEHMFTVHEPLHQHMDVFLCKTQFCQQLVAQYVTQHGWQAEVWYMGHTSSDVLVSAAAVDSSSGGGAADTFSTQAAGHDSPEQQKDGEADGRHAAAVSPIHADYSQFLHVKGKSGLKHTAHLLECWAQHPEFPMLTVIGQSSVKDDITQKVLSGSLKNIQLLPKPAEDAAAAGAVRDMARRLALAAAAGTAAAPPAADAAKPAAATTAGAAAKQVAASGAQPRSKAAASSTPAFVASKAAPQPHQFGRKRQKVQQPAEPEQLQHAPPAAKEAALQQQPQQQLQQPATQQPKQPAKQFGRRRKQPASQLPVQQSRQEPVTGQETTPESAELQESKQKVLELFSTLGLNTEPIAAATRRLLSCSSAFARQLLGSTAATGTDSEKAAEQLAGKHLGWMPPVLDKQQLLSLDDTRQMQASSGVQICVSEREGFGHYLNEARAAGALVVSTDHPPMNELVQDRVSGLLVKPSRTGSDTSWQALGGFSHLNAFLTPSDICTAMQRVLEMPLEQQQQLGRQARQQYLQDKAQFVKKLRVLRRVLHRRRMEGAFAQSGQTVEK